MSNMIPTDHLWSRVKFAAVAALLVGFATGCTDASNTPETDGMAAEAVERSAGGALAPATYEAKADEAAQPAGRESAVLSMKDRKLGDDEVCDVEYIYPDIERDRVIWEEPCADVTAKMMDRAELEGLGRWERLDDFQQGFVSAMPNGKVLYIEGKFTASIYPIDTTGVSIEVPVAD